MTRAVPALILLFSLAPFSAIGMRAATLAPASQVELDRILSRVNGRMITESDVRRARALKLVDDTSSDSAVQRELEDRILILTELGRGAAMPPPSDAEVAARRAAWAASFGGDVTGAIARAGMSENDLQAWLREDLRIRAYLARQFSGVPDGDRARATGEWLSRLRQRADPR